jgi:hypothetical protein
MKPQNWLAELHCLAARFGGACSADLAALTLAEAWGLYCFLRALAERGG